MKTITRNTIIKTLIKSEDWLRVEQIADEFGADSKALRPVVAGLLREGALLRKGQARGSRYKVSARGRRLSGA